MDHESKSRTLLTECHSTAELDFAAAKLTARYYYRFHLNTPYTGYLFHLLVIPAQAGIQS